MVLSSDTCGGSWAVLTHRPLLKYHIHFGEAVVIMIVEKLTHRKLQGNNNSTVIIQAASQLSVQWQAFLLFDFLVTSDWWIFFSPLFQLCEKGKEQKGFEQKLKEWKEEFRVCKRAILLTFDKADDYMVEDWIREEPL